MIQVERVIGAVRQRYPILHSTLPIHYLMRRNGEDFPLIDHMVHVCCALNNTCDSVVPFDQATSIVSALFHFKFVIYISYKLSSLIIIYVHYCT